MRENAPDYIKIIKKAHNEILIINQKNIFISKKIPQILILNVSKTFIDYFHFPRDSSKTLEIAIIGESYSMLV